MDNEWEAQHCLDLRLFESRISHHCAIPDSNITLVNIYYFWFAPTLTYQIVFPRLPRRDTIRILSLAVRMFLSNVMLIFLVVQVIRPTLDKMIKDIEQSGQTIFSAHILGEYVLRLGIASTYVWLLVFYGFFHIFLNLLAEILKFGDRV